MHVLLTNDDGIGAPGLTALCRAVVSRGHTVVIVAPERELSGSGTSLGTIEAGALIQLHPATVNVGPARLALAIAGTPALAVHAAMAGVVGPVPDVVAVGVNPGFNTGTGILHSSTVGAAVTAVVLGRPAVAVSCRDGDPTAFAVAAEVGAAAVDVVGAMTRPMALNVNVGSETTDGPVRSAPLADTGLFRLDLEREDEGIRLRPGWRTAAPEGTDAGVVLAGDIAVTAMTGRLETVEDQAAEQMVQRLTFALHSEPGPPATDRPIGM